MAGDLDLGALPELLATLSLLEAEDVDVIRLDAGEVTFVACCCLRALDGSRQQLEATGARFEVGTVSPMFRAVAECAQYRDLVRPAAAGPGRGARAVTRHGWHGLPVRIAHWLNAVPVGDEQGRYGRASSRHVRLRQSH